MTFYRDLGVGFLVCLGVALIASDVLPLIIVGYVVLLISVMWIIDLARK